MRLGLGTSQAWCLLLALVENGGESRGGSPHHHSAASETVPRTCSKGTVPASHPSSVSILFDKVKSLWWGWTGMQAGSFHKSMGATGPGMAARCFRNGPQVAPGVQQLWNCIGHSGSNNRVRSQTQTPSHSAKASFFSSLFPK